MGVNISVVAHNQPGNVESFSEEGIHLTPGCSRLYLQHSDLIDFANRGKRLKEWHKKMSCCTPEP